MYTVAMDAMEADVCVGVLEEACNTRGSDGSQESKGLEGDIELMMGMGALDECIREHAEVRRGACDVCSLIHDYEISA